VGTQTSPNARESKPDAESKRVGVEIRGQRLTIRSNHDPEFVQRLASHIDGKVAELQKAAPAVSLSKLLMLASMTVAEELFEARQEIDSLRDEISERTDAMLDLLEEVGSEDKTAPEKG
jgi:cell division protein ZapA